MKSLRFFFRPAFLAALALPLCATAVPIIGHEGRIADLAYAELRALDAGSWQGPAFAGEKLPALDAQLAPLSSR